MKDRINFTTAPESQDGHRTWQALTIPVVDESLLDGDLEFTSIRREMNKLPDEVLVNRAHAAVPLEVEWQLHVEQRHPTTHKPLDDQRNCLPYDHQIVLAKELAYGYEEAQVAKAVIRKRIEQSGGLGHNSFRFLRRRFISPKREDRAKARSRR